MSCDDEFWVTNISKMNVSLADLNLTIKAYSSVNLLDSRHYHYTLEQLEKSCKSGSIFKKRDKISKRVVPPKVEKSNVAILREAYIKSRERSLYKINEEHYEELNVTDEEFADENAEIADFDTKPALIKG